MPMGWPGMWARSFHDDGRPGPPSTTAAASLMFEELKHSLESPSEEEVGFVFWLAFVMGLVRRLWEDDFRPFVGGVGMARVALLCRLDGARLSGVWFRIWY